MASPVYYTTCIIICNGPDYCIINAMLYRECGVDSRQGLSEYVELLSGNGADNVKKAYESLLVSEEQHNAFVEGVSNYYVLC